MLNGVEPRSMPHLPLVVGPDANHQTAALGKLLDAAPALKPMLAGATWVGNRRWDLQFQSGETLALPEGDTEAAAALVNFARMDGVDRLLGRGIVRFDMRDPGRFVLRLPPGRVAVTAPPSLRPRKVRARCCQRSRPPIRLPRRRRRPPSGASGIIMAGPRNESLITAIDIGSWKVSALIARKTESGGLVVLGTGQREPGRAARLRGGHGAHRGRCPRDHRAGGKGRRHQHREGRLILLGRQHREQGGTGRDGHRRPCDRAGGYRCAVRAGTRTH